MTKKIKLASTAKTYIEALNVLAANFRKSHGNYRAHLYASLGYSERVIVNLNNDDKLRKRFVLAIRKRAGNGETSVKDRKKAEKKFNLTTEVVAMATGPKPSRRESLLGNVGGRSIFCAKTA